MFQTIRNAWKLADLRRKILFVLFILLLYRVGAQIPVPFMNGAVAASIAQQTEGSILQYLNILSGGAFSQATLFALGISPYITSSIVIQLLSVAIPALERLAKEGEEGKKKINQITRVVTVALALITAIGYQMMMEGYGLLAIPAGVNETFAKIVIIACYCAGSSLVMWLAEKINENGIGNGISLILFVNIVASAPSIASSVVNLCKGSVQGVNQVVGIILAVVGVLVGIAMIVFIVFITNSERRIPVQYAKKVVGRKMYGGQNSTLPIKLNNTGVMPIIFASSIISLPATIGMIIESASGKQITGFWKGFFDFFSANNWPYAVLTFILIIAFAYFYILISFNPVEVSNNLKKNGGSVPGIRPGKPTSDYITRVLNRITLIGAIFLGFIAVIPMIINLCSGGVMSGLAFGGSSIIIVVGVVIETAREIEGQMTMRHYKGFLD